MKYLVLGALATHRKVKLKDLAEILGIDTNLLRDTIYAMGVESWFKEFGRLKGSFGKEEWERRTISVEFPNAPGKLSENDYIMLGLMTHKQEARLEYLVNLLGLPTVNDIKKVFFKLAGYGLIFGTIDKYYFKSSKVVLPQAGKFENLDEDDKIVLGICAVNPIIKLKDLPKETGISDNELDSLRKRLLKLIGLGVIFLVKRGDDYIRALSESELYKSLSKIYPRPSSADDFSRKLTSVISVRGLTTKDGHAFLPISDAAKELGYEDEKWFRRMVYRAVGKSQILVMFDENKKRVFIPRDTPALLPVQEVKVEEVKPVRVEEVLQAGPSKIESTWKEMQTEEKVSGEMPLVAPEKVEEGAPTEAPPSSPQPPVGRVVALRGGEVVGDRYVFKVKVMNDTPYNITNVVVTLAAYPVDCLERARGASELKRINVIEAGGFASPTFELKPSKDCVKGTIKAIVNYVDYLNELQTLKVEPHEISMVCGLLKPVVVEEKEFDQAIAAWVKSGGNIEVKGMNPKLVFERAHDVLDDNNFHIVASHEIPVEKEFVGVIKGFAQGKYSRKKLGVVLEMRGDIDGENTFIKVDSSAEEEGMIAPAIQEVLEDFRKPRLFGKRAYYEKLANLVLKVANEVSGDKGGIVSLADLNVALTSQAGATETPMDSIEEAIKILSKKGLVGGVKTLSSGIKIVEVKPIELSQDLSALLDSVSQTGVTTTAELMQQTTLAEEVVKRALEKFESSGIARKVVEEGGIERWYFPAFYASKIKEEKPKDNSHKGLEEPNLI